MVSMISSVNNIMNVVKIWGVDISWFRKFVNKELKLIEFGGKNKLLVVNVLKNVFLNLMKFFFVLLSWKKIL